MAPALLLLLLGGAALAASGGGGSAPKAGTKAPGNATKLVPVVTKGTGGAAPAKGLQGLASGLGITPGVSPWTALATSNANDLTTGATDVKSRPPANSQPDVIAAWLKKYAVSPVYFYSEFGWSFNGPSASAGYDLGAGDHVTWTASADGSWNYEHTWGGLDIGRTLSSLVGGIAIVADVIGWVPLGMFLHTLNAAANHESLTDLGTALKSDWDLLGDETQLAFSVLSGQWQKAYDAATDFGKNLSGIIAAWKPGKPPDREGKKT